jgi:hypothetical protein
VKLPRRESLHLAAGAAALPITARITCSRRSRNRLQVESRFRLYVSRNAKKAQPVLSNGITLALSLLFCFDFPVMPKPVPVIFCKGNRQKPTWMLHYSTMRP